MKSSKTGLMNQIRRALFQDDDEENIGTNENSQPILIGNSLVDHTHATTAVVPTKTRHGQRQKCTTRSVVAAKKKRVESSSILADLKVDDNCSASTHRSSSRAQGMSVLAGMEQMSISSDKPSYRNRAPTNGMSVLAGNQDCKSVSSSRPATNQGGFMSMFAAPQPRIKPKKAVVEKPVVGGLLAAIGVLEGGALSKKQEARGAGKRGRPKTKKRVSWASESILVSNTTNTVSVMVVEVKPSARSQRAARRDESADDALVDKPKRSSMPRVGDLQNRQMEKKGDKPSKPFTTESEEDVVDSQTSSKPAARMSNERDSQTEEKATLARADRTTTTTTTTPEKEYNGEEDTFMIDDGSPMQVVKESDVPDSETKPTKRIDTKPTPNKFEHVDDDSMAVSPSVPTKAAPQESEVTTKNEMEPPSAFVPVSRVLEVEYLSPSISTQIFLPSPVIESSTRYSPDSSSEHAPSPAQSSASQSETSLLKDSGTTDTASPRHEMRRSRRRPIPTNRFSPTTATQKDQQETIEMPSTKSEDSCPSPSSASLLIESECEEPFKRRSARPQIPTDRFSPSVAMKQAQFIREKPPRAENTKDSNAKNLIRQKKDTNSGRPPRKNRRKTGAKSLSDSDADQQEQIDTTCTEQEFKTTMTGDKIQSTSASSEEWNDSQLLQLKQSHAEVDPTSPTFWSDIALRVQGRTAQECRDKWFSLVKTPAPRVRKPARKDPNVDELAAATEAFHLNDEEDDIFNSTPLRGALFPLKGTESPMEFEETIDVGFDVGSPVIMSAKHNRRLSTEYDDGSEKVGFQPKVGYKTYMMGLKRGVSRAIKEEKAAKGKKGTVIKDGARTVTESVGNKDVSLKGQLSPGGTLEVKNLTETEDDFLDYLSEPSDDEQY